MRIFLIALLCVGSVAFAGPKHKRDGSNLPVKEREFADMLSLRERKIFCGRFSHSQRETAIKYAKGRRQDECYTPDDAVKKVMEETGMSLAVKGRYETE